jgi:hypothetical protein
VKPVRMNLSDKKAMVAGMLGRGAMGGMRPGGVLRDKQDSEALATAAAAVPAEEKKQPPPRVHRSQAPKKGDKDSVLAKAATTEAAGPALTHATKDRAKVPGRKGKSGHRPPTRKPRKARPLAPAAATSAP